MCIFTKTYEEINTDYVPGLIPWAFIEQPNIMSQVEELQDIETVQAQSQIILLYKYLKQEHKKMTVFNLSDKPDKNDGDFTPPEKGKHLALCKIAKKDKTTDGQHTMFKLFFRVVSGASEGCTQWDNLVLSKASCERVNNAAESFELIEPGAGGMIDFEESSFQGKLCMIEVAPDKKDKERMVLTWHGYYPIPEGTEIPQEAAPFEGAEDVVETEKPVQAAKKATQSAEPAEEEDFEFPDVE